MRHGLLLGLVERGRDFVYGGGGGRRGRSLLALQLMLLSLREVLLVYEVGRRVLLQVAKGGWVVGCDGRGGRGGGGAGVGGRRRLRVRVERALASRGGAVEAARHDTWGRSRCSDFCNFLFQT